MPILYDADRIREILRDPGHRYKRNLLTLAATIIVVKLSGANVDPSAIPGIVGLSSTWLWLIILGIIFYNGAYLTYHGVQDWKIANDYFEQFHMGYPAVLFAKNTSGGDGQFEKTINNSHGDHQKTVKRALLSHGYYRISTFSPDGSHLKDKDDRTNSDDIRVEEAKAMKRMIYCFWGLDIAIPFLLSLVATILIGLALSQSASATEIKPVDGDTFWYNGTKLRLSAIDTPEPSKYGNAECAYEAQLGDRASAFTKNVIKTRKIEIEWSGRNDKYGRALAKVRVGNEYLGDMLVDAGLAKPWRGRQFDWCKGR